MGEYLAGRVEQGPQVLLLQEACPDCSAPPAHPSLSCDYALCAGGAHVSHQVLGSLSTGTIFSLCFSHGRQLRAGPQWKLHHDLPVGEAGRGKQSDPHQTLGPLLMSGGAWSTTGEEPEGAGWPGPPSPGPPAQVPKGGSRLQSRDGAGSLGGKGLRAAGCTCLGVWRSKFISLSFKPNHKDWVPGEGSLKGREAASLHGTSLTA